MQTQTSKYHRFRQTLPVLGIFAGGAVSGIVPHGAFGTYDAFIRAVIIGIVAGLTAFFISVAVTKR